MSAGSLADRRTLCRSGILIGAFTLLLSVVAAPVLAQGPGLPRTYSIQRIDSPSPILAGGFGLVTMPIGDVNNDGEVDFATNQTEGTPNNEGRVWIFSGETGGELGNFAAPDPGNPTNVINNNRALVDRWMDRLGDIGSCPANTAAGQTCTSATIGAPDGANEFLLGAEGVDVDGVRDVGRVYVIDGRTFSVLKRIDMPPGDRALLAARQAQFPVSAVTVVVRGGFGRTASTPRGLPPCTGNSGVTPCPDNIAIPPGVRKGDFDARNEVQRVTVSATSGNFRLTFSGQTTANIAFNTTAASVEAALEALSNLEPADVTVSGAAGGPFTVTFLGAYADVNVPEMTAADVDLAGAGDSVAVATVTQGFGGGQPDIVIGANRFTEIGATANPASHCAKQADPNGICFDAGRTYVYRGEEIVNSSPAEPLDGVGVDETPPRILKNLAAQSDANDISFTRSEIFGHAQMPIGDVGVCRTGGTFPAVNPGEQCSTLARTNVPDGKPEVIVASHRADTPIFNPNQEMFETGVTFLVDGATGAILFIYNHPQPQPNALFGYSTRQSFPLGDLFGTTLPDVVLSAFQDAQDKSQAGRAYLFNGDFNNAFQVFGQMNDPTPTTRARFGIPTEGVGDLDPAHPGNEVLVGNFPSNTGRPDAITDLHFFNPVDGLLQTIADPDQQQVSAFGYQAAPLGDLNEDGFLDFATSAPNWDSPASGGAAGVRDQGRIYVFRSDNSRPPSPPPPPRPPARTYPDPPNPPNPPNPTTPSQRRLAGCASGKRVLTLASANDTRNGTRGADLIFASAGNDVIDALAGDDCVDLGSGNDRGRGGAGKDLILGRGGRDRLSGGSGGDRLNGDAGNDRILGGGSNDVIKGGSGSDVINGGSGRDRVSCGRGRDTVTADRRDRVARDCERVRRRR